MGKTCGVIIMMRKVTEIDEGWDFPYSIIESREGIVIIVQSDFYPVEGEPVPVEPVGDPTTWADVHNLGYSTCI